MTLNREEIIARFVLGLLLCHAVASLPTVIKIGGLFDTEDEEQELAFRIAIDWINSDKKLLPKSRLKAQVERLVPGDSYDASKKVCGLLGAGVAAVFGPQSPVTSMHVASVCDELEVPHVQTRWDPDRHKTDLAINLHPNPVLLSKSYTAIVQYLGWQNFTLLYEENDGITRLQNFLKEADYYGWNIQIYKFDENKPFRDVMWQIKKDLRKMKIENQKIVLDVSRRNIHLALKHAQQVGMVTEHQQYFITSLDLNTIDLEDFRYSKSNITGFRLVQEATAEYKMLLQEIISRQPQRGQLPSLRAETALIFDAVWMFAMALQDLDSGKEVEGFPSISCDSTAKQGTDGTSLINYMKSNSLNGITGKVSFDGQGSRDQFPLDIVHLTEEGLIEIGYCVPHKPLPEVNITRYVASEVSAEYKRYIITSIESKPYVMLKTSAAQLTGNDRFEGFCIDLIEELSKLLHFSYTVQLVLDKQYGQRMDNGKWTGMIGEVMRGEAHMAVAGLSINSKREQAVDFTMPFMNTGISILFKKPTQTVKSIFSFLSPFSGEVWIYLMFATFGVSVVTFFVGRLTPYEWINPHPCRQDDIVVENTFNFRNSLWFIMGSLMQQGSDLVPTAFCTRTALSFWNFFTLILVSSYTANLAAFLTVEKVIFPIESAEDLANQAFPPKIKYGCINSGSTRNFFEESKIDIYKKMWEVMAQDDSVFAVTNEEGKRKVYEGDYAFFMEAATIEYTTERECELAQIGTLLDSKGYGIAIKKGNWELVSLLNSGILTLQEDGIIHTLKEKWWKQKGGGKCGTKSQSGTARELGLPNVGGVFVVLIFGLGCAIIIALIEYWWKSRQHYDFDQKEFWKMVMKELKFALSCENTTKPVPPKKPTPPRSSSGSNNSRFSVPSQATN